MLLNQYLPEPSKKVGLFFLGVFIMGFNCVSFSCFCSNEVLEYQFVKYCVLEQLMLSDVLSVRWRCQCLYFAAVGRSFSHWSIQLFFLDDAIFELLEAATYGL